MTSVFPRVHEPLARHHSAMNLVPHQTKPSRAALRSALAALGLLLPLTLGACSGLNGQSDGVSARGFGSLPLRSSGDEGQYTAGLEGITKSYVRDISAQELTLAGLDNLTKVDGSLFLNQDTNGHILLASRSGQAVSLDLPRRGSNRGWARFTAEAVRSAKVLSPRLASLDREDIYEAVFDGYMSRLDKHSRYWTPKQAQVLWEQLLGFGGIGINLEFTDSGVKVLKVIRNSPAERAGLQAGDLIVGIDGVSLNVNVPEQDTLSRLRGEVGSQVTLSINRGGRLMSRRLVREQVVPQTVDAGISDGILYLEISGFAKSTAEDVAYSILVAQQQVGGRLRGIILDLRENPGGLLPAATIISDLFLREGLIVSTRGRSADANQEFYAEKEDISGGAPIVVLVNGNSASAAEILAAALQDNRRAVVVGSSSYGKGSVQTNIRLPNDGRMSVTLAEFFGPAGLPLNTVGVTPALCTTAPVVSPQKRLSLLASGRLDSPLPTAAAHLRSEGYQARELVRNYCPPKDGLDPDDLAFAKALLQQPAYYTYALGLSNPNRR